MGLSYVKHLAKHFYGSFYLILRRIQRNGDRYSAGSPKAIVSPSSLLF